MIPLGDASRRPRRIPFITVLIILVNGFVFLLELTGGEAFVTKWSLIPAEIVGRHHWITILTAMFMHGRQAIEAYWERGIKASGHTDFVKPLTLYYTGDLPYCAGTYQATNAGMTVDGRILVVLRKVNGKWLMPAHETVVNDQPL